MLSLFSFIATLVQVALVFSSNKLETGPNIYFTNSTNTSVDALQSDLFVSQHNQVRKNVSPLASPSLLNMSLSSLMASYAKTFTQACIYKYGGPSFGTYGQNIFASTGGIPTPFKIVNAWANERRFYNYATAKCDVGHDCSHYTQIVWRKSLGVGCNIQLCTTNSPFHTSAPWYFAVCNYAPHGNYVGERPYK